MQLGFRRRRRHGFHTWFVKRAGDGKGGFVGTAQLEIEIAGETCVALDLVNFAARLQLAVVAIERSVSNGDFAGQAGERQRRRFAFEDNVAKRSAAPFEIGGPGGGFAQRGGIEANQAECVLPVQVLVAQGSCINAATCIIAILVNVPEPKYFGGDTVKSASQFPA